MMDYMSIVIKYVLILFGLFVIFGAFTDKNYPAFIVGLYGVMFFIDALWERYSINRKKRFLYGSILIFTSLFISVLFFKSNALEGNKTVYSLVAFFGVSLLYGHIYQKYKKSYKAVNNQPISKEEDIELNEDINIDGISLKVETFVNNNSNCSSVLREATKLNDLGDTESACEVLIKYLDECETHIKLISYLQKAGKINMVKEIVENYLDKKVLNVVNLYKRYNKRIEDADLRILIKDKPKYIEKYKNKIKKLPKVFCNFSHTAFDKARLAFYREGLYKESLYYFVLNELFLSYANGKYIDLESKNKKYSKKIDKELLQQIDEVLNDYEHIEEIYDLYFINKKVSDVLKIERLDLENKWFLKINTLV